MHLLDFLIFTVYMMGIMGIGLYHYLTSKSAEDYYVGNRSISAGHVGLSIVATDVGGGFSIGLGGVGFTMGLAGSWLLFTGLVGAWMSAVLIIPRIKKIDAKAGMMTYPDFLRFRYNDRVALAAALISAIGYMGFTGAQMLAGAKLATATMLPRSPFGLPPQTFALVIIAFITIVYTVIGGLKAVIYTDTVQWIILLAGLILLTIPATLYRIGSLEILKSGLPDSHFSLLNIRPVTFVNWMITIIPIWFVGMTLYQRMFACRNEKEARRAWYIAGFFEYPLMAFTGVFLGMCGRFFFPAAQAEAALPMLIKNVLPVGITGIVIAAYFSAIMSTADSCLMASSGNLVNDVLQRHVCKKMKFKTSLTVSRIITLVIGLTAVTLAARFQNVLDAILYAYSFMVSGLFIPTLGAYFWPKGSSRGALLAMFSGGGLTLLLMTGIISLPPGLRQVGLDVGFYGILLSLLTYIAGSHVFPDKKRVYDHEQTV